MYEIDKNINQGVTEGSKTPKYWHPSSQSIKPKPASDVMYARHPDEDGIHYPDYGNTNKPPRKFRVKDNDGDTTTDSRYDRKGKLLHRISIDNESVNLGVAEMRDRRDSYQRDYDSSQTGFGRGHDHRGLGQELAHETNNIAIAINGKTWKVIPCKGTADSPEEYNYLRHMKNWAEKKSASSGKKWTVHLTGASVTESATAGATSAANVAIGPVYKNKPAKAAKNKDGTVKNALDMKANLLTGGSIKR